MASQSFQYSFTTSQQLHEVFRFLLNPRNWWTGLFGETIEGASNNVNDVFTFYAGNGIHFSKQRLTELNQNKNITWEVTESKLSFLKNPSEWTGSTIRFDMEQTNNETKITFSHLGLTPGIECFEQCSSAWIQYLQNLEQQLK